MKSKWRLVTPARALLVIAVAGLVVFGFGLTSPFLGDDNRQIVNNTLVHSFSNVGKFFQGGTFYNGSDKLGGVYFRPLMMTAYSLIYSVAGANAVAFHAVQLLLQILVCFVLFLVFRYFFKPVLSLFLALVFLLHPIDSQAVYSISAMQEPLFFLFGLLAVWTLLRFSSRKSLLLTALLLLLSLFAKESGILFCGIVLVGLYVYDRKRLLPMAGLVAAVGLVYIAVKLPAVGIFQSPNNAPMLDLSLWGRLATVPSIVAFYITKFIFPVKLAEGYYWTYPSLGIIHFWLPLLIDVAAVGLVVWAFRRLRKPRHGWHLKTFVFFLVWFLLGLSLHMWIVPLPLDMTACETWFLFPMVGLLGMIGVALDAFSGRINRKFLIGLAIALLVVLGARTSARGFDWHDAYSLAALDVAASPGDYIAENILSAGALKNGDAKLAKDYAEKSVANYPNAANLLNLGLAYASLGDYKRAKESYLRGVRYQDYVVLYENLGALTIWYGDEAQNKQFLLTSLGKFPQSGHLWLYLGVLFAREQDFGHARYAVQQADKYGVYNQYIYDQIMSGQPLNLEKSSGTE